MLEHNYAGPRYLTYGESFLRVSFRLTLCLFAAALIACLAAAVAVDSAGNLAVGAFGGSISIFKGPITGSGSASATFQNGTSTFVDNLAFNSAGDLLGVFGTSLAIGK